MNAMFLQHIVDADTEMKIISESVVRQSVEIVNLKHMKIASDNKSQRDDRGIRDDMRISVPNKSRETVPKTYSISHNVTSTDVRKRLTLSAEVTETPAITSNISVDIYVEQIVKCYSDIVRNDNKFQQVKNKSRMVYGISAKNTLRARIFGVDSVYKKEDLANFLNEHTIVYASLKCYSKPDSVSKTLKVSLSRHQYRRLFYPSLWDSGICVQLFFYPKKNIICIV